MKLYRDYPFASMSFGDDPDMLAAVDRVVRDCKIDTLIETGTYLGTGSTKILADFFVRIGPPKCFVTMEVNWQFWQTARKNLRHYGFVDSRWGASIERERALEFIRADPMLRNHQQYPDIFIDDIDDPVRFYSSEVMGSMVGQGTLPVGGQSDFDFCWDGENLLARMLQIHRRHNPLIVLDSAGGIGYLEFQTMLQTMGDVEFALLLDDTHHIKHYRSLQHIRNAENFEIVGQSDKFGWVVALHHGR